MSQKLLLIDGHSIINRAFYGLGGSSYMTAPDKTPTGALFGFMNIYLRYVQEYSPDKICVCFDTKGPTFRHEKFSDYKGTRKPTPDELLIQIPILKEILDYLGVARLEIPGFEADDLIGSMSLSAEKRNWNTYILSGDRDALQLVSEKTTLLFPTVRKGESTTEVYEPSDVMEKYQVSPDLVVEMKGIMGDSSDNIPGVKGIGEKGALELVTTYGNIEKIYENIEKIRPALAKKLTDDKESAFLSRDLAIIKRDIPVEDTFERMETISGDEHKLLELFERLGFRSLIARMDLLSVRKSNENKKVSEEFNFKKVKKITSDNMDAILSNARFYDFPASSALSASSASDNDEEILFRGEIRGRYISDGLKSLVDFKYSKYVTMHKVGKNRYLLDLNDLYIYEISKPDLGGFLEKLRDKKIALAGYDLKPVLKEMTGNVSEGIYFDIFVVSYLLNIPENSSSIENLMETFLNKRVPVRTDSDSDADCGVEYSEGSQIALDDLSIQEEDDIHQDDVYQDNIGQDDLYQDNIGQDGILKDDILKDNVFQDNLLQQNIHKHDILKDKEEKKDEIQISDLFIISCFHELVSHEFQMLSDYKLAFLALYVELPLTGILAEMERTGFYVDPKQLDMLNKEFTVNLSRIQQEIYDLAGEEFNINSPKQLGEILFNKLKLPSVRKTKTGYSTNSEVLSLLRGKHRIIPLIEEYREISKLNSTFVEGLSKSINPKDGRIHTIFHQALTSTGRLSSSNPNMQNIPIRTELGRTIRRAFCGQGKKFLVDGDYSQIELRLLADFSGDEEMSRAFLDHDDIHMRTAEEIFDLPRIMITPDMRGIAKTINFSIVYGIGDFSLAKDLGISIGHAREYINEYHRKYPRVRPYLDKLLEDAYKTGYVRTLLGRRRYVDELKASNRNIKQFGERAAKNAPLQGSAADIIKVAMVILNKRLKKELPDVKLVLQVHDELILETSEKDSDLASKILKECMESAVNLNVPLIADVEVKKEWY